MSRLIPNLNLSPF